VMLGRSGFVLSCAHIYSFGPARPDWKRHDFTSSIAVALNCTFEEAEPHVLACLQCMKPRSDITDEERDAARASLNAQIRQMGSHLPE
jgi:hypothetical protein